MSAPEEPDWIGTCQKGQKADPPKLPYPCKNSDFWQNFVLFIDLQSLKRAQMEFIIPYLDIVSVSIY